MAKACKLEVQEPRWLISGAVSCSLRKKKKMSHWIHHPDELYPLLTRAFRQPSGPEVWARMSD